MPHWEGQEAAEAHVLDAAARLIAERGLAKTNVGAICARTGYPSSVVYQLFVDKEALVRRFVEQMREEFIAEFSRAVAERSGGVTATPPDMLRALIGVFFELLTDLPVRNRAFLVLWGEAAEELSAIRPVMTEADRRFRFAIAQTVSAGLADGTITGVADPDAYAFALLGQLRGISIQLLIDPNGIDVGAVRAELERGIDRLILA